MKKYPSQQSYAQPMAEVSVLKESTLPPFNVPLRKNSSQACASNLVQGEKLQPSSCSMPCTSASVGNVCSLSTRSSTVTTVAEDSDCNERVGSKTVESKENLQKIEFSSTAAQEDLEEKAVKKVPGEALSMSTTNETLKDVQAMTPDKPNRDSIQVGDVPCHNTIVAKRTFLNPLVASFQMDLWKLKHLNMHPKILKRSKKCTINAHVYKEILLDKDCLPLDLGPSTSEKSSTISLGMNHCRRKKAANAAAPISVNNSSSLTNNMDGEVKERIYRMVLFLQVINKEKVFWVSLRSKLALFKRNGFFEEGLNRFISK
ncbi:hypothetical protein F3Y22_tig00111000pilonHSYRG00156 [Hibiscus syriacus]|uniref:Uncharacterized protein n=1 Tax=Hibiscus syriacus TaxID=106335 RepID=A0A6A2ZAJ6_HIBSY|nr:hypothetical protein F3Y22_tig00111000pilonHSYRG00156 [Hibiscus syriacus]